MRKITLLALALLAATATDATAQTVVRGSTPTAQRQGLPVVMRGTIAREVVDTRTVVSPRTYATAGEVLWLVDDNGGITGCNLRSSGYVGRNIVYCTNARSTRW